MKVVVLLVSILLRECTCCPSFTSSVEEWRAVCPGEELTYTCAIFDDTGFSSTVWRMTPHPCDGGVVLLFHGTPVGGPPIECGEFSAQLIASDGDCYTSTLTVTASPELNGTVVTCDSTDGSATIMIETGMLELVVTPTYEISELKKIMTTWNAICSEYSITVACGTFVNTSLVSLAECPGETCVSEVNIVSGATDDCTVSVSAADLSNQTTVFLKSSDYVGLTVTDDASPTVVMYSFQPDYPGEACLKTDFSYMDENEVVTLTITSAVCGDSELKAFLPPAKYYSYVASTFDCGCGGQFQQSVIIEGTGTTGDYDFENCTADLLLRGNDIGIGSCGAGNSASVSYTTLTPGSTATYTSCPGYEGGDVTLTCLPNGNWDGTPPDYNETPPTCGSLCLIIICILAVLLLMATALFIIFLVLYCIEKKNNKAHPDDAREFASSSSPDSKPTTQF